MVKSWLVQDQTVLGKDYSNLLIADSLLKTIWFINAPCYDNEALASPKANELTIPEQTATGKGTSNPLMAGSLPKTTKPTLVPSCCVIFNLEPLSLYFDFVFSSENFKSFSYRIQMNLLDRVSQLHYPFSLPERLKADITLSCLLEEQLLEPALNLNDHCCGREFRVLNCYDQKSLLVHQIRIP
ncbi:hypothetical protein Tco_0684851 [Tanacetum coccineum]